ncbi:MAG: hypothetical protein ACL7BU_06405 [Candidatus Phlomobacter fragariae]
MAEKQHILPNFDWQHITFTISSLTLVFL